LTALALIALAPTESKADDGFRIYISPGYPRYRPYYVTKGAIAENGTSFPAVPNPWLITRSRKEEDGTERIERQWIVESDYLYPEEVGASSLE
jgi:hypothetical protein